MSSAPGGTPTIAIFDANYASARWFARAFSRLGYRYQVYHHAKQCVARYSRYAPSIKLCPNPNDLDVFGRWATQQVQAGEFDLIAPTSDLISFYLAQVLPHSPEALQVRMPRPEDLLGCLFKDRFISMAQARGVAVPRTACAESIDGLIEEARSSVGFPLVLKPRSHVAWVNERGRVVRDVDEMQSALQGMDLCGAVQGDYLRQNPAQVLPIAQAYLPAAASNCVSVSGVFDAQGRCLARGGSVKLAQVPATTGIGVAFRHITDEAVLQVGEDAARKMIGCGLFELELVPDADSDQWLALDLNPRAFGQMDLDIANNRDLPTLWGRSLCAEVQPVEAGHKRKIGFAVHPVFFPARLFLSKFGNMSKMKDVRARFNFMGVWPTSLGWVTDDWIGNLAYCLRAIRMVPQMMRRPKL